MFNAPMDAKALRHKNFLALLDDFKTLEALADATDSNPRHLSQIKNGKSMGAASAGFLLSVKRPRKKNSILLLRDG